MGLRAGAAYVDVLPRLGPGFDASLSQQVEGPAKAAGTKASSALGGALKNAAIGGGALFAARELGQFAKGAVDASSDLNEAYNVTGLIFKDARGEIDEFVKSSAKIGLSEARARELTAGLGGLLTNLGLTTEESVKWSKQLTTLGADMGSAFNAEPAEAIEAIGSALRGETEPIRRFNVVLNESLIKAEAVRLGLAKGAVDEAKVAQTKINVTKAHIEMSKAVGKFGEQSVEAADKRAKLATAEGALEKALAGGKIELTENQKAQAALSIITEQTAAVQGDFANTSDGLANRQRILRAEFENTQAKLGTALLPVMEKLTGVALTVVTAFSNLSPAGKAVIGMLAGLAVAVAAIIQVKKAWIAVQAAVNIVMAANPIGLVIIALAALAVGIALAWKHSETFRAVVTGAFGAVVANGQALFRFFEGLGARAVDAVAMVTGVIGGLVEAVTGLPGKIGRAASGMFDGIKNAFRSAINFIIRAWNGLEFTIGGFDPPGPGPKIPSVTLGVPKIPLLASGGRAVAPGLAVVGERGAEVVKLGRGDSVFPQGSFPALAGAGGGWTVADGAIRVEDRSGSPERTAAEVVARLRSYAWTRGRG